MSLKHLLGSLAILIGTVSWNSAVAQEPVKVEVKQSTPEEAWETYRQGMVNDDYESVFKVSDETYQLNNTRSLIMNVAMIGLPDGKKDAKYKVLLPSQWVTPLGNSWSFPQKKRIRVLKLLKFLKPRAACLSCWILLLKPSLMALVIRWRK